MGLTFWFRRFSENNAVAGLARLDAIQLQQMLRTGQISSLELVDALLEQYAAWEPRVGAFLNFRADQARDQARELDRRRSAGADLGLLAGLPVSVKDILCTVDYPTTCGSRMLRDYHSPFDATVVARIRDAGGIVFGKTNLDEFAMGSSTENSALAVTRNPWNTEHVPGGSSGGGAASVSAGICPLAIGTDTGGSIRQPAAFCGISGLKPTYGRVSRYGLVAFASSLDQAGPMARSVPELALLLEAIAGHDPRDATSAPNEVPSYSHTIAEPLRGLRIGIVPDHFDAGLDAEVDAAVREALGAFRARGATVREIELPASRQAIATYYVIAPCEASSNLARYDGVHFGHRSTERDRTDESPLARLYCRSRAEGLGAEVKRRIMLGTYALSSGYYEAYYLQAMRVRRLIRDELLAAFQSVDVIVGPTTPAPAYRLGEKANDPLSMYLEDLYTVSANLAGIPALSVPCGLSRSGLPIGLQIQAAPFAEELLLRAGAMYQQVTDWHQRRPAA
ncbi:MAG: Asp-tRNA(Asn)/Glu-tRNA(Gln) amidotransferase subunit GatA [Planctomycetes bacterium]|nr:Asp-tRNA(Asn)/Glu-tRNA(Gln) amidotransferase subunit GatA [Planctomycetota bacterium]